MSDKAIAACASESGRTPQAYVAQAFQLRHLTLRGGEYMTVAVAIDPCLALGQSTRVAIYERIGSGYRRVLDAPTLPAFAQVSADGTATMPTHDSVELILESTYVWNGTKYVFSAARSHLYDVALGERRPYEVPVRFAPGTSTTTLSGTVAYHFGDEYVLRARAGQRISIRLQSGARPPHTGASLYYDDDASSLAQLSGVTAWSGTLPKTGTYRLFVSGTNEHDEYRRSRYEIRLAIR
ncbi:MAG TPA: hypothetical protein VMT95_09655 [Candidatus Binatia bacterium]|nr:hypothetical protein [Candidatus Binatia bacterium]